jgi:hypothetical protein
LRYFLDTEFSEKGPTYPIELISIGIVAEDGREFYIVSSQFDADSCNDWVKANVLPSLGDAVPGGTIIPVPLLHIKKFLIDFIGNDQAPEFYGYYADYDWVCFAQIFGTMMDLPKGWPKYCRDLKQWCDDLGNPKLPEQGKGEHNALADARWNRDVYAFLTDLDRRTRWKVEATSVDLPPIS